MSQAERERWPEARLAEALQRGTQQEHDERVRFINANFDVRKEIQGRETRRPDNDDSEEEDPEDGWDTDVDEQRALHEASDSDTRENPSSPTGSPERLRRLAEIEDDSSEHEADALPHWGFTRSHLPGEGGWAHEYVSQNESPFESSESDGMEICDNASEVDEMDIDDIAEPGNTYAQGVANTSTTESLGEFLADALVDSENVVHDNYEDPEATGGEEDSGSEADVEDNCEDAGTDCQDESGSSDSGTGDEREAPDAVSD